MLLLYISFSKDFLCRWPVDTHVRCETPGSTSPRYHRNAIGSDRPIIGAGLRRARPVRLAWAKQTCWRP